MPTQNVTTVSINFNPLQEDHGDRRTPALLIMGHLGQGQVLQISSVGKLCCFISCTYFCAWRKICVFQCCWSNTLRFFYLSTKGQAAWASSVYAATTCNCVEKWCLVHHSALFPNKCISFRATIWTHHPKAIPIGRCQNRIFCSFKLLPSSFK